MRLLVMSRTFLVISGNDSLFTGVSKSEPFRQLFLLTDISLTRESLQWNMLTLSYIPSRTKSLPSQLSAVSRSIQGHQQSVTEYSTSAFSPDMRTAN